MAEDYNRESGIPGLKDAQSAVMRVLLGTRAATKGGLVIGSGDAKKLKIANTVEYSIGGVAYKVTTEEVDFTDVTIQPISSTRYYVLCYNAAGTGLIVNGKNDTDLPNVPATHCPVGYAKLVTDATGTFVPATDDLSDAAVTDTFADITVLPLVLI
jgi:hypothetical protein